MRAIHLFLLSLAACGPMQTSTQSFTTEGELAVPVTDVRVVGRTGDLQVIEEVGAVHLTAEAALSWRGDFQPVARFGVDGSGVSLDDSCPPSSFSCQVAWDVRTPPVEVRHQVGSGNVTLFGALGPVNVDVGTGTVSAEGLVDSFTATVGTGGITGTSLDVGSVLVSTGTGDVDIRVDHDGTVGATVEVGTGDVSVDLAGEVTGARLRTGAGDIRLTLPAGAYNFDLATSGQAPELPAGLVQDAGGGNVELTTGAGTITLLVR